MFPELAQVKSPVKGDSIKRMYVTSELVLAGQLEETEHLSGNNIQDSNQNLLSGVERKSSLFKKANNVLLLKKNYSNELTELN